MTATITRSGRSVKLTAHKAILSGRHHGNTIGAVRECIAAGVPRLELDIHSIDGADYAIYHERRLERETDATGPIGSATPEDIRRARFQFDPHDGPPLLSDIVRAALGSSTQLQLDLKDWRVLPETRIRTVLDVIAPVHGQVIVTCGQEWNLRRLRHAAPDLALGFDPGLYIDSTAETTPVFLPRTMGAYGYRDDHPMAAGKTEDVTEYLAERVAILTLQAPWAQEFFLNYVFVLQTLDDGFDVTAWLHQREIGVTAWTPDYRGPESLRVLDRLMAAGVDRITTNTIPAWLEAAGSAR